MSPEDVVLLIQKYEEGIASPDEKTMLESWYISKATDNHTLYPALPDNFKEIKTQTLRTIISIPVQKTGAFHVGKKHIWIAGMAASFLLILFGGLFLYHEVFKDPFADVHIPPGHTQATLTLADGTKLIIDKTAQGSLAKQAGVDIIKTEDGQLIYKVVNGPKKDTEVYNKIETPIGGEQIVLLQDGSKVHLNASSSISFPSTFANSKERTVELTGEAYFEIVKNTEHPFIVKSRNQHLQILGTHFNLSCYSEDANVRTTLLEGSVKIIPEYGNSKQGNSKSNNLILKPGQQSIVNTSSAYVINADMEEAVAWKNGYFRFNDEKIESVMKKIARWYDIKVEYSDDLSKEGINGTISRFTEISDVLRMLEKTKTVHFKVEGRRITVMK